MTKINFQAAWLRKIQSLQLVYNQSVKMASPPVCMHFVLQYVHGVYIMYIGPCTLHTKWGEHIVVRICVGDKQLGGVKWHYQMISLNTCDTT